MSLRLGVLADDFSGALASAARIRAHPLRATVVWDEAASIDGAEAVVVDMRTRDVHERTQDHAERWARWLLERGCELLELRLDSTLRGAPAAELTGLLEATGRRHSWVVAVPAFPSAGRVTAAGRQRTVAGPAGGPLDQPVGPALFGDVAHGIVPLDVVDAGADAIEEHLRLERAQGQGRFVVDALEERQLKEIATAVSRFVDAGDAPVTASPGAWLRYYPVDAGGVVIVVVSSPTAQNREQLAALELELSTAVVDACDAPPYDAAIASSRTVVVETVRAARPDNPDHLAHRAAGAALEVIHAVRESGRRIDGIVATGGHTAASLLDQLQPVEVVAEGEVAPLCPVGTIVGGPWAGLRIVTKGGLVGDRSTLTHLASTLRQEPACQERPLLSV